MADVHALILFSHGSLLCGAGEALEAHAARLRERGGYDRVAVGYLNYSEPRFAETADRVIADGATRVTVLPYFLVPGYFVGKALPDALAPVQAKYPHVTFTVAPAIGYDEALAEALLESAQMARGSDTWRDPLARAARACRPSADCPLYGTPQCPKVPSLTVPAVSSALPAALPDA